MKPTEKTADAQGVKKPVKSTRKIQISVEMLNELANDTTLKDAFVNALEQNTEMKAPIAYQFAKAMVKQTKIELK